MTDQGPENTLGESGHQDTQELDRTKCEQTTTAANFQSPARMPLDQTTANTNSHHQNNNSNDHFQDEWIMLNVGGQVFTTTRTTLCHNEPNSMLARMFSQHSYITRTSSRPYSISSSSSSSTTLDAQPATHLQKDDLSNSKTLTTTTSNSIGHTFSLRPSPKDANGAYLIDRSPKYFEPILNYLRHGKLIIDHNVNVQGVLEEAKFYGIVSLLPMLELETERHFKKRHQELLQSQSLYDMNNNSNNYNNIGNNMDAVSGGADGTQLQTMPPLTRQDVIKAIMSTSASTAGLRFQGCNLAGANLSKLDLRHVNLKYANLRNSNLKGANLSFSNLERADLYQSNLEGAQLTGANLANANLENSNLRAVTIIDPTNDHTKPKTSFEGANLRNTNFEGSRLAQVNLRVAILKGSNLQNCDLSQAILAGADLENCDLSGSDLNEANLRSANIKGAQFELEVS